MGLLFLLVALVKNETIDIRFPELTKPFTFMLHDMLFRKNEKHFCLPLREKIL